MERGYNLKKLRNIAKEVSRYNRDDLLAYKIKVKDSVSKIPKDLFVQWHPKISKLSFILNKNTNILKDSSHLSKIFPEPPKVFYQRKQNMKDILCNSDVTKRMESDESKTRNQPCNHGNCLFCTSFGKSNLVINKQKDRKMQDKNGGTCQTKTLFIRQNV